MRHLLISIVGLGLASFAGIAGAQEDCTDIADNAARLSCYDAKYRPATASSTVSRWVVRQEKSKIDDTRNVFLSSTADEPVPGQFGASATPVLFIRCSENQTSLYIAFDDLFMADIQGYGRVTFRKDSEKAFTENLDVSTDNHALGYWSGAQAIPMTKKLFGGDALLVRATPFNESAVTFTVSIAGLEQAIAPLREACGW